jgi:hypothetical protein
VQRKAQKEDITTESSIKLCQVGIKRVQRVHEKNSILSSEIRKMSQGIHSQGY